MNFEGTDRYAQAFEVFRKVSSDEESMFSCLRQHLPIALQKLHLSKNRPRINIMSIGAGNGLVDQEILKIVQEGYSNTDKHLEEVKILNTAIEPHPNMVEKYKASIEERMKSEESVQFDLKPMSFEEYAESKHDPNQYDMVHAIHSLYHMNDLESTLKHCYYNELGEKGLIACIHAGSECIFHLFVEIPNKTCGYEDKKEPWKNSNDVVAIVEKNHWKFERIDCHCDIDVTGILRDNSDEGRLLLDFLTRESYFCQSANKESIDGVYDLLQKRSTEGDDGRLVVQATSELILIYKS